MFVSFSEILVTRDVRIDCKCVSIICRFGREFKLPCNTQLEEYDVFYIGGESLCLTNLMMTYNKCQVCEKILF